MLRMGGLQFYCRCLRHAPKAAWISLGAISTAATYVPPLAVKLFHVAEVDMTLIIWLIPVAIILCFILVPFREAFRLYKEKDDEFRAAQDKHQYEMSSLRKEKDQLLEQLRLRPTIEILDRTEIQNGTCRVFVTNHDSADCQLSVQIEEINPAVVASGFHLQITHDPGNLVATIPGGSTRSVDVFNLLPDLTLLGPMNKPTIRRARYELTLLALCRQGRSVQRKLVLDPNLNPPEFRIT
jgi:hypothetical protein